MGYCVVNPNTIKSNKGAITVKTVFATLAEAEEAKREAEARQAQRRARSRSYGIER